MQLLVTILKRASVMDELMRSLAKVGVRGATVLDGIGMAESLVHMEDLPLFGVLRRIMMDDEHEGSKVMLIALEDRIVGNVMDIVRLTVGDMSEPNTGIMFTLPIIRFEGIS